MRDYEKILDFTSGLLLIAVLAMAWLLVWCYVNPDESLAADNWKSIVTGGLIEGEARPALNGYYTHPLISGDLVPETPDSGCLDCHNDLP